jgi:hypothetical protein
MRRPHRAKDMLGKRAAPDCTSSPVQLSGLTEPVNAVVRASAQKMQAGLGTVMLPPADHVPSMHGVVQEVPVLPAGQMPTARWGSVMEVQQAQNSR